jgi:hypothetical protein
MRKLTLSILTVIAGLLAFTLNGPMQAQKKSAPAPPKPAVKAAAPATKAAAPGRSASTAGHTGPATTGPRAGGPTTAGARTGGATTAGARGGTMAGGRPGGGAVTSRPGGGTTMRTADNREFNRGANGHVESFRGAHGETARFDRSGHVSEIRSGNMRIDHGPDGVRRVEMERADHSRLVMEGHGRGYIQRPYMYGGHSFYHRDYYAGGVRYSRFYRPYSYHGLALNVYVPGVYYAPAFYGWAYAPLGRPVAYAWGWGAAPWYGYYGAYYAPYPSYPAPAYWLTDYVIAAQLQAAYAAGAAAGAAGAAELAQPRSGRSQGAHLVYASYVPPAPPELSPAVKKLIVEELQADLKAEEAAAAAGGNDQGSSGLEKTLSDGQPHTFVVSTGVTVSPSTGDCGLTAGDVVQTAGMPGASDTTASMTILASKQTDCSTGSVVPVKLDDLAEMQNAMLASMDEGLGKLKANAGQGGLPKPPAAALVKGTEAPYASAAPAPDPNEQQDLQAADQEATQTEQQVLAQATPPPDGGGGDSAPSQAAPVTIALGQSLADVAINKGRPKQIVNLGAKTIYVYDDMKVIFLNGKVSDVQ